MKLNSSFIALLLCVIAMNSFAAANTEKSVEEKFNLAPEATTAEATLSFRDIPVLKKAFIDATPIDRKDGILVGELGVDGGNKAMIVKLAQELVDSKHDNIDSLLIAHKGKLLFESYYLRGRINLPHFQASATKVYTSMALGRAIQLGYLTMADLDKPLVSFLKNLDPTKFVEGVEKITLHHAMTMRTGIRISKEKREELAKTPEQLKGQGQVQAYLEHSAPITAEFQRFLYGGGQPNLVMQVLDAVVPGTAKDFIKKELLDKLGITNYAWMTDVSGLPSSGWGASMTSRDMIKWGTLAFNKGKWEHEQLVSEAFIAKAISSILYTDGDVEVYGGGKDVSNQGYGYYWWSADLKVGNKSYFSVSAQGGGGQYIILIEELDLMIVITAHEGDNSTLQTTAEKILPAFIQKSIPTLSAINENQDKPPVLEGPYLGQKPPGLTPEVFAPSVLSIEDRDGNAFFTPNMKEFYFTRKSSKDGKWSLVVYKSENNRWHESVVGPRVGRPILSPDGKTMHLGKNYMQRTKTGWSEVKSLGPMFDREDWGIMRLSASAKGTYVFDDARSNDVIRISRLMDGKREEPKLLGKEINTGKWTAHPFISPDESYLIWDSEKVSGYGVSDLYISFRQQDDSWGAAINMGDKINTTGAENGGYVTPDGKYFFFNSPINKSNSGIHWVDAQIIETLRPK
jgi:CubicO group peptidase (beta-lactamase class C family)